MSIRPRRALRLHWVCGGPLAWSVWLVFAAALLLLDRAGRALGEAAALDRQSNTEFARLAAQGALLAVAHGAVDELVAGTGRPGGAELVFLRQPAGKAVPSTPKVMRQEPLKPGVIRSLRGVHVTFTGIFAKTRKQVAAAARRAGAVVHSGPSAQTSVIVRGRPNALQAAGRDGGLKLMEIKRLRRKGHRITVLSEAQFWRLAARR